MSVKGPYILGGLWFSFPCQVYDQKDLGFPSYCLGKRSVHQKYRNESCFYFLNLRHHSGRLSGDLRGIKRKHIILGPLKVVPNTSELISDVKEPELEFYWPLLETWKARGLSTWYLHYVHSTETGTPVPGVWSDTDPVPGTSDLWEFRVLVERRVLVRGEKPDRILFLWR